MLRPRGSFGFGKNSPGSAHRLEVNPFSQANSDGREMQIGLGHWEPRSTCRILCKGHSAPSPNRQEAPRGSPEISRDLQLRLSNGQYSHASKGYVSGRSVVPAKSIDGSAELPSSCNFVELFPPCSASAGTRGAMLVG